jgi:hypothetical protein
MAGGNEARIVVIPTGASSIRFDPKTPFSIPIGQGTVRNGRRTKPD